MRLSSLGLLIVTGTLLGSPAIAGRKPVDVTWGKAGVSFADYRRDTLECANKAYGLDVSMRPETVQALSAANSAALYSFLQTVELGFSRGGLEYRDGTQGYQAALNQIEPGRVVFRNTTYTSLFRNAARTDVVDQLQAVVDYCLASRGYTRFHLNAAERQQLHHLRYGTEARARFLHGISANPAAWGEVGASPS